MHRGAGGYGRVHREAQFAGSFAGTQTGAGVVHQRGIEYGSVSAVGQFDGQRHLGLQLFERAALAEGLRVGVDPSARAVRKVEFGQLVADLQNQVFVRKFVAEGDPFVVGPDAEPDVRSGEVDVELVVVVTILGLFAVDGAPGGVVGGGFGKFDLPDVGNGVPRAGAVAVFEA